MQIKIYNNFSEELLKEFDENMKEFDYFPFQDLNWLKHWYETIGIKKKILLKIFIIYDEGIPIFILPFCIKSFFIFNILEWAGGLCSDYHGPIINKNFNKINKVFFNKLWDSITKELSNIDLIHLQKQKKFKNTINPFIDYFKNSIFHHKAYQLNFLQNLSSKKEKKIKKIILDNSRQYKRLSKFGNISFQDPDDKNQKKIIISKMIEQKEIRYKQTNTWNMFSKQNYKDFYNGLLEVNFKDLEVSVCALTTKNEFIACHVGLIHRDIFYYLMPSFDFVNWNVFSPGNILLEHLINKSKNQNLNIFDFTIGGEEYKKKWTNEEINLYEHLSAKNFKGLIYLSIYVFLIFLKKNVFFNFLLNKISIKIKSWLN